MPAELTLVLHFASPLDVPSRDDVEHAFDCDVVEYEEDEV